MVPQCLGDPFSLARFIDDTLEVFEDDVVLEKRTCVLGYRVKETPQRCPRFAV